MRCVFRIGVLAACLVFGQGSALSSFLLLSLWGVSTDLGGGVLEARCLVLCDPPPIVPPLVSHGGLVGHGCLVVGGVVCVEWWR